MGPDSEALYGEIESRFGRDKLATLYGLLAELNEAIDVKAEDTTDCVD